MTKDEAYLQLRERAKRLVKEIRSATVLAAFDTEGFGPIRCLEDERGINDPGPITMAAEAVRQAILDVEAVERSGL